MNSAGGLLSDDLVADANRAVADAYGAQSVAVDATQTLLKNLVGKDPNTFEPYGFRDDKSVVNGVKSALVAFHDSNWAGRASGNPVLRGIADELGIDKIEAIRALNEAVTDAGLNLFFPHRQGGSTGRRNY